MTEQKHNHDNYQFDIDAACAEVDAAIMESIGLGSARKAPPNISKMTEQKHTPEPWVTDAACGFPRDVHDAEGVLIAHCSSDIAARRIVAAVNACAGIDTELLESSGGVASTAKCLAVQMASVKQQRDQLRAALASMLEIHESPALFVGKTGAERLLLLEQQSAKASSALQNARAALAATE